jgi:uncharacterized protein
VDAGDFSSWLEGMQAALRGERDSAVPCDGCTACCRASQFIHIGPDETDTLAHVPAALLFPAPRMPAGHKVLGYDERGHCPMLIDDRCSIYDHRPRACRTYDCRIFPAAGLEPDGVEKAAVAERARRWRFRVTTPAAGAQQEAVKAAAAFLRAHPDELPAGVSASNTTQIAMLAISRGDATETNTPCRKASPRR